jgi:hypothetical protein
MLGGNMGNENGFVFTPKDGGIGHHTPVQNMDFTAGDKMKRSSGQSKVFDNNGGTSKAGDAGTINPNGSYGPITYGYPGI